MMDGSARHEAKAEALRDAARTLKTVYGHSETASYLIAGWACEYENGHRPRDFDVQAQPSPTAETTGSETP